jgi:Flp pilus assembly protein TadG
MSLETTSQAQPAPRSPRRDRRERGQSIIELAFVLPVFLVIIMATVDFGLALKSWITITNAAREGARYAAVTCVAAADDSEVITETEDAAADLADDVTVTVVNCPGDTADSVVVTVDYTYTLITPLGGMLSFLGGDGLPSGIDLSSSSDMRLE